MCSLFYVMLSSLNMLWAFICIFAYLLSCIFLIHECVHESHLFISYINIQHAMLAQGYEFVIRHTGPKFSLNKDENETPTTEADVTRLPVYFVASSLILRDEWVGALKVRSDYRGRTVQSWLAYPRLIAHNPRLKANLVSGTHAFHLGKYMYGKCHCSICRFSFDCVYLMTSSSCTTYSCLDDVTIAECQKIFKNSI